MTIVKNILPQLIGIPLAASALLLGTPAVAAAVAPGDREASESSEVVQPALYGDTLQVRYRLGIDVLDLGFADNAAQVDRFVEKVRRDFSGVPSSRLSLTIYGGASPEGPDELNRRLGERRGMALRDLLLSRLGMPVGQVTVVNQGARWGGLREMVEKSRTPWRAKVLDVLGKRPGTEPWNLDPRELKLRKMDGGRVWNDLLTYFLPPLREAGSAVMMLLPEPSVRDTIVIRDTIVYLPEPCPVYEPPIDHNRRWAVKTNLLLCGLATPNLAVEIPFGGRNRWSVELEGFFPWWVWNENSHAHCFVDAGVELRLWLGNRRKHHTLDGWHVGLAGAAGYYDWEWTKHKGYQGEFVNTYLNLGYQHRFGSRWAVDGGLGVGFVTTRYRRFLGSSIYPVGHEEEWDRHLMWQYNGHWNFLGATHANISIAYLIGK